MNTLKNIDTVYQILLKKFGPQGWWPLFNYRKNEFTYSGKKNISSDEQFEIILGAILTQNVSWSNVEKCFQNLAETGRITLENIEKMGPESLSASIVSSGYYNQKTKKIFNVITAINENFSSTNDLKKLPDAELRAFLLSVNGIGPETADSIMLYAYDKKTFVIDAYTKRLFHRLGNLDEKSSYNSMQTIFHTQFSGELPDYKEYHALIVALSKDYCRKKPQCGECPLQSFCKGKIT